MRILRYSFTNRIKRRRGTVIYAFINYNVTRQTRLFNRVRRVVRTFRTAANYDRYQ